MIQSIRFDSFDSSSHSPSRAFYMRAIFSVITGMVGVEPTIEWLPRLSPQLIGSAPLDHYLGGWVARPLNGLLHEPFLNWHRTARACHIDRPQNIRHRVDANASMRMAGFGCPMCPLNVLSRLSVLTSSGTTIVPLETNSILGIN
jgi:hypothetical protein